MSKKINLSEAAIDSLYRISKWTKFFSILGFIFAGISLLGALFYLASQIDAEQGNAYRLGYSFGILGLGTLYYFLSMHLYKFSKKIQESINSKDDLIFEDAMMHFSSYWLITGVVTVVVIAIYILMLLGAIITAF
tara:strand:+ start:271 stop:675 length:405 start_codon:yes stop_codon:yes gene_type:complete